MENINNEVNEEMTEQTDKLKEAGKNLAQTADKWEAAAREQAANAGDVIAGTADRLVETAKEQVANATNAIAGFADKVLDALTGKSAQAEQEPQAQEAQAETADEAAGPQIEPLSEEEVDFETFSKSDFRIVKVKECFAVPKSKKLLQFTLDDGTGTDRTILSGIHAFYEPEQLIGKTLVAITNLPPRKMMGIESCGMLLSALHKEAGEEKLNLLMVSDSIPAGAKLY